MENTTKEVKIITADPSALGLFGLAIITLVASSQKLGITSGTALVLPWAIFLGATAQLFAVVTTLIMLYIEKEDWFKKKKAHLKLRLTK